MTYDDLILLTNVEGIEKARQYASSVLRLRIDSGEVSDHIYISGFGKNLSAIIGFVKLESDRYRELRDNNLRGMGGFRDKAIEKYQEQYTDEGVDDIIRVISFGMDVIHTLYPTAKQLDMDDMHSYLADGIILMAGVEVVEPNGVRH